MGQYRPMFNISLEHTYFSNGRLPGVQLVPTGESARLMANTNMVTRKRDDGITVFFDHEQLDTLRLYAADEDDPLQLNFECEVDSQTFRNYTADAEFSETRTLYFDSANTDPQTIGTKYLHSEEFVSPADLAELFAGSFTLRETHSSVLPFSTNRALLFDAEQTARNPRGKIPLDPADLQQSRNLTRGMLSAAAPASRRPPSLGLISIRVSSEELEQITQGDLNTYNDYHIRFKARETHWKYFILGDANREGVFVKDAKDEIEFDYLGEEEVANGRKAKVFLSRQAIPLRDRAKPKFQLLVPRHNRLKVLVKRLAVASANRINKVKLDDRELFVSEIYVNF
jgi:hypothetical protein